MKWFRVYSEARTDAKLESLTDAQHRVWFRLMCFAGDQDERGAIIGYDEELLAVEVARGDVDLLRATLERLVKLRIIEAGDDVRFINWQSRQYDKPSDSPEQTRERKRKSRAPSIEETPVTPMSRDVTPHKQKQIADTDSETDTDPEPQQEDERVRALPSATVADTADALLLADWINDERSAVEKAVGRSFQLVPDFNTRDGPVEAEKFGRRNAKNPPSDWYRAWLNWLKKAVQFEQRDASEPRLNGRTPRGSGESSTPGVDPDIERRGYDYDQFVNRTAAAGR